MKTIKIQFALFFQSDYTGLPEDFASLVQKCFGQTDTKVFVPLPNSAPSEIPRVELKYTNFQIKIAKSRIDLFCEDDQQFVDLYQKLNRLKYIDLNINIIRIGLVFFYFEESKSKKDLAQIFSEKVSIKDLAEVDVRLNNMIEVKGYKCNNLNVFQLGREIGIKGQRLEEMREGILIQNDFNNVPSKDKILSEQSRQDLVTEFIKKSKEFFIHI